MHTLLSRWENLTFVLGVGKEQKSWKKRRKKKLITIRPRESGPNHFICITYSTHALYPQCPLAENTSSLHANLLHQIETSERVVCENIVAVHFNVSLWLRQWKYAGWLSTENAQFDVSIRKIITLLELK